MALVTTYVMVINLAYILLTNLPTANSHTIHCNDHAKDTHGSYTYASVIFVNLTSKWK